MHASFIVKTAYINWRNKTEHWLPEYEKCANFKKHPMNSSTFYSSMIQHQKYSFPTFLHLYGWQSDGILSNFRMHFFPYFSKLVIRGEK